MRSRAVFDDADDRFAVAREQLHTLLDEAQFAAAARSTLNAHYTDPGIVAAVWDVVAALGFDGGEVLEPGCGAGNFLHHAPTTARVGAVELDPTTARVAAALHPEVAVRCESFADTPLAEGSMDLAIGNVPFAAVKLHDRHHNPGARLSIHDHFVVKALHLVRPGGLVAVLTSRYTLDARSPVARRQIAALAELVGAVRLPSGAHEKAAGTDAVSDLLILRRRVSDLADPAETVRADGFDATDAIPGYEQVPGVQVNRYFVEHPDRVLGEFALRHGAYSAQSLRVEPHPGELDVALRSALAGIVADARAAGLTLNPASGVAASTVAPAATARTSRPTITTARPVSSAAVRPAAASASLSGREPTPAPVACDGAAGRRRRGRLHPDRRRGGDVVRGARGAGRGAADAAGAARHRGRAARARGHRARRDPGDARAARRAHRPLRGLPRRVGPLGRFTLRRDRAGRPGDRGASQARVLPRHGGFRADPHAAQVYALEQASTPPPGRGHGRRWSGGHLHPPRHRPAHPPPRAESPADALAICLDEHARGDRAGRIARLLEVDEDTPAPSWARWCSTTPTPRRLVPAAEYLSGNVRDKLAAAEAAVAEDDPPMRGQRRGAARGDPGRPDPGGDRRPAGRGLDRRRPTSRSSCARSSMTPASGGAPRRAGLGGPRQPLQRCAATQTWGTSRLPGIRAGPGAPRAAPIEVTDTSRLDGPSGGPQPRRDPRRPGKGRRAGRTVRRVGLGGPGPRRDAGPRLQRPVQRDRAALLRRRASCRCLAWR